jgi:hypothetical protein
VLPAEARANPKQLFYLRNASLEVGRGIDEVVDAGENFSECHRTSTLDGVRDDPRFMFLESHRLG